MRKTHYLILVSAFLISVNAMGQRPVIELTFTAKYLMQYVPLDSIYIQNLTQPGDTMLYAPDTVLLLDYINGIPDYQGNVVSSFSVSPNYPNPSADGRTSIDVFIPTLEMVTMRVFDIIGNEVAFFENTLDAGNHHFTFLAGKERYYVLSVNCGNETRSVKMINAGNNPQNQSSLIYRGSYETEPTFKSQNEIVGFGYSIGDELRFIGYAKSPLGFAGSDVIEAAPAGNENYVFEILEGLPCPGIPTVFYEGQNYKTVLIGTQCWFKENLNVGVVIDVTQAQTNNSVIEKYCFDNLESNCDVYGGLYQWDEMMQYSTVSGAQGICPPEWHLPTDAEWAVVIDYLGGESVAGGKMKSTGTIEDGTGLWYSPNYGATNSSGFSGHPGGYSENTGNFINLGNTGLWWSSTELSATNAWHRYLTYGDTYAFSYNYDKNYGFSVRCVLVENPFTIPSVTTLGITEITPATATGGGEVIDDGGAEVTAHGVCWSTSQNPTIADSHTQDGSGTGVFVSNLTGLTPNTPYFVRAYATNSVGTAYGNEVNFTTLAGSLTCGDVVSYEGQDYNTIQMGTQCWFLDNLNVGIMITENQTNNGVVEKYCYNNDPVNCEIYGGLYDWGEVMQYLTQPGIQAICPTGWHIPTDEEFTTFTDYISSQPAYFCDNSGFNNAKAIATTSGWYTSSEFCAVGNDQSSNNASGFSGIPAGFRWDTGTGFNGVGYITAWYSSTEASATTAKGRMFAADDWFIPTSSMSKNYGFSVRCLKNETSATIPTVTTSGITDITQTTAIGGGDVIADGGAPVTARGICWSTTQNPTIAGSHTEDGTGNGVFVSNLSGLTPNTPYFARAYATNSMGTAYGNEVNFTTLAGGFYCGYIVTYEGQNYNTVAIGAQCWFKENLNVGIRIDGAENQTNNSIKEKYCHNNNPTNCDVYGGLYLWDEMMQYTTSSGVKGICPTGWHIPTDDELTILINFLGGESVAGGQMKETGTTHWSPPNTGATNSSGFTALPGGYRFTNGSFYGLSSYSHWWSSSEKSSSEAWGRYVGYNYANVYRGFYDKFNGFSVRCLNDN